MSEDLPIDTLSDEKLQAIIAKCQRKIEERQNGHDAKNTKAVKRQERKAKREENKRKRKEARHSSEHKTSDDSPQNVKSPIQTIINFLKDNPEELEKYSDLLHKRFSVVDRINPLNLSNWTLEYFRSIISEKELEDESELEVNGLFDYFMTKQIINLEKITKPETGGEYYKLRSRDSYPLQMKQLQKKHPKSKIGKIFAKEGYTANFPVLLIPGYGATAMSVWKSEEEKGWEGERCWLGLRKIGSLAKIKRLETMLLGRHAPQIVEYDDSRTWLKHIMLNEDCYSDPPGIQVRPLEGVAAVDYLSHSNITRKTTFVFGPIIQALKAVGYNSSNLKAAPYDWRLPIPILEKRDGYFTSLKSTIENMVKFTGKKVVIVAHSMGNRVFQSFLCWNNNLDPTWVEAHVHAQMALGAPFLGAAKPVRGLLSGDALGLELFLQTHETLSWNNRMGSLCSLIPLCHSLYPQSIVNFHLNSVSLINRSDSLLINTVVARSFQLSAAEESLLLSDSNASSMFSDDSSDDDDNSANRTHVIAEFEGDDDDDEELEEDGDHEQEQEKDAATGRELFAHILQQPFEYPESEYQILYPESLFGNWEVDEKRSDSLQAFAAAIESHGVRSRIVQSMHHNMRYKFKVRGERIQLKIKIGGVSIGKYKMRFTERFSVEHHLENDSKKAVWFSQGGTKLYVKTPLKRKNLFQCLRLCEDGKTLFCRIIVSPKVNERGKPICYNRYYHRVKPEKPEPKTRSRSKSLSNSLLAPSNMKRRPSRAELLPNKDHADREVTGEYSAPGVFLTLQEQSPRIWAVFEDMYLNNPLYFNSSGEVPSVLTAFGSQAEFDSAQKEIPVLNAPHVPNLWVIYGTGLETEVSYYYRANPGGSFILDTSVDKTTDPRANPSKLKLKNGIGYETTTTEQKLHNVSNSGDGTVPYCSLAFPRIWRNQILHRRAMRDIDLSESQDPSETENEPKEPEIGIIEVIGAEHREMLADEVVHYHLLHYVCTGTNPHAT